MTDLLVGKYSKAGMPNLFYTWATFNRTNVQQLKTATRKRVLNLRCLRNADPLMSFLSLMNESMRFP